MMMREVALPRIGDRAIALLEALPDAHRNLLADSGAGMKLSLEEANCALQELGGLGVAFDPVLRRPPKKHA